MVREDVVASTYRSPRTSSGGCLWRVCGAEAVCGPRASVAIGVREISGAEAGCAARDSERTAGADQERVRGVALTSGRWRGTLVSVRDHCGATPLSWVASGAYGHAGRRWELDVELGRGGRDGGSASAEGGVGTVASDPGRDQGSVATRPAGSWANAAVCGVVG